MAQYNITLEEGLVRNLLMGNSVDEVLKQIMEQLLNQLLEAKATDICGAGLYEQNEGRSAYRNGYRDRSLVTRFGKIELLVPRVRDHSALTEGFIEKYKRSEQALIAGIAEMVVSGVSTRKVDDVAQALFGTSVSKSQVSRICGILDPIVDEFRNRPLDGWYPFMIIDAMYIKVREDSRVVSKALHVAIGINSIGHREVLGVSVMDKETKESYADFFGGLKVRGLNKVDLGVSDNHAGLVSAFKETFLGASWQRCHTHFSRNMLDKTPKKHWAEVKERLREIYTARNQEKAKECKNETMERLREIAPKAVDLLDEGFDDITAVLSLPVKYRTKLRTSNLIERLNEELRRRDRPIRIFPNEASVIRILGTVIMEIHEKWKISKLEFDMKEYFDHISSISQSDVAEKCGEVRAA